jgi:hypothetical protein
VASLPSCLDADRLIAEVDRLGGAVVAAHPFRGWRPLDTSVLDRSRCTALEVENGRNSAFENAQAARLAFRLGIPAVAGSDAHALDELGRFPTRFHMPVAGRDDLVRALREGLCEPAAPFASLACPISAGSGRMSPSEPRPLLRRS